jgi:hypothetical protein
LTLTIIGQRVLPQRFLAPLHRTQRLLCRVRVEICFSSTAAWLTCLMTLSNQLSLEGAARGTPWVRVIVVLNSVFCSHMLSATKCVKNHGVLSECRRQYVLENREKCLFLFVSEVIGGHSFDETSHFFDRPQGN